MQNLIELFYTFIIKQNCSAQFAFAAFSKFKGFIPVVCKHSIRSFVARFVLFHVYFSRTSQRHLTSFRRLIVFENIHLLKKHRPIHSSFFLSKPVQSARLARWLHPPLNFSSRRISRYSMRLMRLESANST